MTGIAVSIVDQLGRRPLLLGGVSGMVILSPLLLMLLHAYVACMLITCMNLLDGTIVYDC